MRELGSALDLADYRVKRTVSVLRGAKIPQSRMRLGCKALQKRGGQSRFADAGFAREQYYLSFASLCFRPATLKDFKFLLPAHELSKTANVMSVEPALYRQRTYCSPGSHGR